MAATPRNTSVGSETLTEPSGKHAKSQWSVQRFLPRTRAREIDEPADETEPPIQHEDLTYHTTLPDLDALSVILPDVEPPNLEPYDNPFEWSNTRKNVCVILACAATFQAGYSGGSYAIAAGPMEQKWNLDSVSFSTGFTAWSLGFAICPMILAPLSEINGRRPVLLFAGVMFLAGQIGCAATQSFAGMIVARFFVGAAASVFSVMFGGVLSDVFYAKHRNTPMALYSAAALAGQGAGPMVSGFIVQRASTWRWVFWHQVIWLSCTLTALFIFFKEPRGSILLSRKARKINTFYDELDHIEDPEARKSIDVPSIRYKVAADEARSKFSRMLYLSLTTPFKLLVTESVVFWFSLWSAFAWGICYALFNVIPLVFRTNFGFDTEQSGAVFAAVVTGTILATLLAIYQEKLAVRYYPSIFETPEGRLYFTCAEAILLPVGLFWFGWTTSPSIPWIVPVLAIGCVQMGIFSIYLAVFNYLADTYHRLASSALACQSFCRNVFAAVFPLFTPIMFTKMGYAEASSLLGGIAALLTVYPFLLTWKGKAIRGRSKIASEIMEEGK